MATTPDFGPRRLSNTVSGTSLSTDGPPSSLFTLAMVRPMLVVTFSLPSSTLRQFWTFG
jgi:hypothetical protein